jgi:hypothetical protein
MGREQEARVVLATIAKTNGVPTVYSGIEATHLGKELAEFDGEEPSVGTRQLSDGEDSQKIQAVVAAGNAKVLSTPRSQLLRILYIALMVFGMQTGCAMTLWTSDVAAFYGALNSSFYTTMIIGSVIVQCVHIFSYFLFSTSISPWDVLISGALCCFAVLIGIVKALQGEPVPFPIIALFLVLWNIPFSLAWGALYCAIIADSPAERRATAVGMADAASRFSAMLHPIFSAQVLVSYGPVLACSIFAQGWLWAASFALYLKIC